MATTTQTSQYLAQRQRMVQDVSALLDTAATEAAGNAPALAAIAAAKARLQTTQRR